MQRPPHIVPTLESLRRLLNRAAQLTIAEQVSAEKWHPGRNREWARSSFVTISMKRIQTHVAKLKAQGYRAVMSVASARV